jgi:hypothetical protein
MSFWSRICVAAIPLLCGLHSCEALAHPTMFVKETRGGETGDTTWEGNLTLVPNSKEEAGVSVEAINAFIMKRLSARAVQSPSTSYVPICLMNFAHVQDIVSSDRATQVEIRSDLETYPRSFSDTYVSGSEVFLVRIGIFEDCRQELSKPAEPARFMALVITDHTGNIREFDALNWNFIRIFKRTDGGINLLACFACGEIQELRYNPSDREFYYKWIGH